MKYSIITACFGNYDSFKEPKEIDPDCEYIYVTDNRELKSNKWKIVILDDIYKNKSNIWKAFYVRYHIEEFVSTDIVIWIDASVQINKSLKPIIEKFLDSKSDICLPIHWYKESLYDALKSWYRREKDPRKAIDEASLKRAKNYIARTIGLHYCGHAEANFQIVNIKNKKLSRLRKHVWRDLLKIGNSGDPFRFDEIVLSSLLQSEYRIVKIFKVCRQLLVSSYMTWISHDGKKIGRGYDPNRMCKSSLYFYNSSQKINPFF